MPVQFKRKEPDVHVEMVTKEMLTDGATAGVDAGGSQSGGSGNHPIGYKPKTGLRCIQPPDTCIDADGAHLYDAAGYRLYVRTTNNSVNYRVAVSPGSEEHEELEVNKW